MFREWLYIVKEVLVVGAFITLLLFFIVIVIAFYGGLLH
jgi:hypothetical protein